MLEYEDDYFLEEDKMGMTVTSGNVTIQKDSGNLIGISIGGGAPLCPCLYIVQVFDNTPAAREGTLQAGDELVGINGQSVKGKTKVEVAKMIQAAKEEVNINFNKLHADPRQGKSLDIIMKKVKHRLVENMSTATADALGLSRAILCNDTLVKKLDELQNTELMYKGMVEHARRMLHAYADVFQSYKTFGDVFAAIGVKEPQPTASEAFRKFGEMHRQMEKDGHKMLQNVKSVLSDMGTYLHKAIPDTRLTIKKYADAKFEYLSYCLKVKEMDDEEHSYAALQEPLYRVDTGNYEYRLILRCRQEARSKFAQLRSDVLVKMELLDNKHAEVVCQHLVRLLSGLQRLHDDMLTTVQRETKLFPVEVDLTQNAFQYKSTTPVVQDFEDDDILEGEEVQEDTSLILNNFQSSAVSNPIQAPERNTDSSVNSILNSPSSSTHLIPDLLGSSDSKPTDKNDTGVDFDSFFSENMFTSQQTNPGDFLLGESLDIGLQQSNSFEDELKKVISNSNTKPLNVIGAASSETKNNQDLLIPGLGDFEINQVEPDYTKMDNLTLLSTLSINDPGYNLLSDAK